MVQNGWEAIDDGAGAGARWHCCRCAQHAKRHPPRAAGRIRVLLVDDEPHALEATQRVLQDFEVIAATSAEQALKLLDSMSFDIIVSDVAMHGLRGSELYERVCLQWPHLAQRFVFISDNVAQLEPELLASAQRVGQNLPLLVDKASTNETLAEAVSSVAARAAARSGTHAIRVTPPRSKVAG